MPAAAPESLRAPNRMDHMGWLLLEGPSAADGRGAAATPVSRPTPLHVTGTSVRDAASGESASSRRLHDWAAEGLLGGGRASVLRETDMSVLARSMSPRGTAQSSFSRIAWRSGALSTADAFPSEGGHQHPHLQSLGLLQHSAEPANVGVVEVTCHPVRISSTQPSHD